MHVDFIAGGNDWAVQVALAAGLELSPEGPLFTRGELGPMAPYLPERGVPLDWPVSDAAASLTARLVAIDSVNPSLVPRRRGRGRDRRVHRALGARWPGSRPTC